jgi:hypothetical protein
MKNRYFAMLLLLLFISKTCLAVAPTVSDINVSSLIITDHNYSNWKSPSYSTMTVLVTGADLNKDGCGYAIDSSWTYPTATDLNTDTNTYRIIVQALAVDDTNWCITCKNNSGETSAPSCRTLYLDSNVPNTGATFDGDKTLTFISTDAATNTGNGSGIQNLFYRINDGTWVDLAATTGTVTFNEVGIYSVDFYAVDALDNNEGSQTGFFRTIDFTVDSADLIARDFQATMCTNAIGIPNGLWLIILIMLIMIIVVVVTALKNPMDISTSFLVDNIKILVPVAIVIIIVIFMAIFFVLMGGVVCSTVV